MLELRFHSRKCFFLIKVLKFSFFSFFLLFFLNILFVGFKFSLLMVLLQSVGSRVMVQLIRIY